jgi:hypothetical protein
MIMARQPEHVWPIGGRHCDKPLSQMPSDYLVWAAQTLKLSTGLREAVAGELRARGEHAPEPPPWSPPPCRRCGVAGLLCSWAWDSLGRRYVPAACAGCGCWLANAPCRPPFTEMADAGGDA